MRPEPADGPGAAVALVGLAGRARRPRHSGWLLIPGACRPRPGPGRDSGGEAALAIGPEGGFTDREVEAARAAGWQLASLGATLLRVETAGLVGCAAILALSEVP